MQCATDSLTTASLLVTGLGVLTGDMMDTGLTASEERERGVEQVCLWTRVAVQSQSQPDSPADGVTIAPAFDPSIEL